MGLRVASVLALVALGVVLVAHRGEDRALVAAYGTPNGSSATGVTYVDPGQPVSVGNYLLCLTTPGAPAHIDSVEPVGGNGRLKVTAFSVRPEPAWTGSGMDLGDALNPLAKLGFRPSSHDVRVVCSSPALHAVELGVQLASPGGVSTLESLLVTYTIDGSRHALSLPAAIALCEGKQTPACIVDL